MASKNIACFIGFGSAVAGPPFMAATSLRVPTIIHEQNIDMGRANRIMKPFATKIALSFPRDNFSKKGNFTVTGTPIRETASRKVARDEALGILGLGKDRITLLIMGGSQGSQAVNTAVIELLKKAAPELLKKIQIIHISGEGEYSRTQEEYGKLRVRHKLFPFFENMCIIYSATDIAISRAGASTISELSHHAIASILIPYPFAGEHQLKNANFIDVKGGCILIEQRHLAGDYLGKQLLRLVREEPYRLSIGSKMADIFEGRAAERLLNMVDEFIELG